MIYFNVSVAEKFIPFDGEINSNALYLYNFIQYTILFIRR